MPRGEASEVKFLSTTCTLKTEQCDKASKATERSHAETHDKQIDCGTASERMQGNIQFQSLEACIILKENQEFSDESLRELRLGQAGKSARGMPWHQEPTKDVTSCDKPRGGANIHRSGDFRMGQPGGAIRRHPALNQIGVGREPPELKHLSRARKRHQPRFRQ